MPFDFAGGAFDIGEASTAFNAAELGGLDSASAAAEAGISSANAGDFAVGTDGLIGSAIPGAGGIPGADGTLIVDYDQPFLAQSVQPGLVDGAGSVDSGGVYDFQGPDAGVQTDYAVPVDVNNSAAESARLAALNENGLPVSQPSLVDQITGKTALFADQVKAAGANAVSSLTTQIQAEIPKLVAQAKQQLIGQAVGAVKGVVQATVAKTLPPQLAAVANNVVDKAANSTASAFGATPISGAVDLTGGGGGGGNGQTGATFTGGGGGEVTAAGLIDAATTDIKNYGNQLYADTARKVQSVVAGGVSSVTSTGQSAEAVGVAIAAAAGKAQSANDGNAGEAAAIAAASEAYTNKLAAQRQEVLAAQRKINNNGDWRVRLTLAPGSDYLYNDPALNADGTNGILWPLKQSGGVIFPYTPKISTNYTANYSNADLTHSNYRNYFYQSSNVGDITLLAKFTAQDTMEAQYLLAVIHFFRSVTKMFYGLDAQRGAPPPLVFLTGFGEFQFQNHPCVVSRFGYELPENVDYIRARSINVNGMNLLTKRDRPIGVPGDPISGAYKRLSDLFSQGITKGAQPISSPTALPPPPSLGLNNPTYVPTSMEISLTLYPVVTRSQVSKQFSLQKYATGQLLAGGFW